MTRPADNDRSNPIARAFARLFDRGNERGNERGSDATARTASAVVPPTGTAAPTPGAGIAQRADAQGATPQSATAPSPSSGASLLVGAAAGMAHPDIRQTPVDVATGATQGDASVLPDPAAPASGARRTYIVVEGDSLPDIARAVYGRADRWQLIFEANRDTIADPDRIRPGQVLVLPDPSSLH